MVTGTFDMLQPGNLSVMERALSGPGPLCVVVEDDAAAASHAEAFRPRNPAAARALLAAALRGVGAASVTGRDGAPALFVALAPYTLVTGAGLTGTGAFTEAAAQRATGIVEVPRLAGCTTPEIVAFIRAGATPIRLPDEWREPPPLPEGAAGRRVIVTVNGCFDVLHAGHVRFLERARAMGDRLIVLVNDDASVRRYKGPTRPVFPLAFRSAALRALEPVSEVRAFAEDTPMRLLAEIRPDRHVKGGSYEAERVREERDLVESWGGKLVLTPLVEGFSTTALIRNTRGV
jgi:rfaE bifunctional protein nucleotidyltransferase chain/domain